MSYPPPAHQPNWFSRLSPLQRVGVLAGAVLLLCCGGAAGFVALLPGDGDGSAGRRTALVEPAGAPPAATTAPEATTGSDDATAGPDDATAGPDDATAGPDDATAGPDAAPTTARPTPARTSAKPVSYANCAAVRAAGKAPLRRGQPGYRAGLDADRDGVACESATRANGGDAPNPPPKPKPKVTTDKPDTDPRFGTCKEARANGYGPYRRGEPEYAWYRDADDDGVVCE